MSGWRLPRAMALNGGWGMIVVAGLGRAHNTIRVEPAAGGGAKRVGMFVVWCCDVWVALAAGGGARRVAI
ncbi:MAG: hypothetical protein HKL96_10360 [Phycisphaerales bacterium]|nr:hypothetical protein [Phycisphaerales bacterium]